MFIARVINGMVFSLCAPLLLLLMYGACGARDLRSYDHWGLENRFLLQRNEVAAVVVPNSENDELAASAAAAEDAEDG